MQAIEFETYVENGQIILPPLFSNLTQKVKIILLWQEEIVENNAKTPVNDKFAGLKATMLQLQALNPFSEIADPVEWQRQLRNEW